MVNKDIEIAILSFEKVIAKLKESENIGLDIQNVKDLKVVDYKSRGFSRPAIIKDVGKAELEKFDFADPDQIKLIIALFEGILRELKSKKPNQRSIKKILGKLASFGSWATLAYSYLHNCGLV